MTGRVRILAVGETQGRHWVGCVGDVTDVVDGKGYWVDVKTCGDTESSVFATQVEPYSEFLTPRAADWSPADVHQYLCVQHAHPGIDYYRLADGTHILTHRGRAFNAVVDADGTLVPALAAMFRIFRHVDRVKAAPASSLSYCSSCGSGLLHDERCDCVARKAVPA